MKGYSVLIRKNQFLATLLFLVGLNAMSQRKMIDSFGNSSQYCSNTFCLYSDSTFTFERGCEGRSSITFGVFKYAKDTLILLPVTQEKYEPIKQIDFINTDTLSFLSVVLQADDDSSYLIQAEVVFTTVETAEKWKKDAFISDLVSDTSLATFVFEPYGGYVRKTNEPIAACLVQLERLTSCKEFVILKPQKNQVLIRLNMPLETLKEMNLYEMKYENMKTSLFNFEGRKIRVLSDN